MSAIFSPTMVIKLLSDVTPSLSPIDINNIVGAAIQAFATIIAVIVGYLLSVGAERRAWQRRKIEQLREQQLTLLLTFAGELKTGLDTVVKAFAAIESQYFVRSTRLSQAITEAQLAAMSHEASRWLENIDSETRNLELRCAELQLLGFADSSLATLRSTVDMLAETRTIIQDICVRGESAKVEVLKDKIDKLGKQYEVVVQGALAGIHD